MAQVRLVKAGGSPIMVLARHDEETDSLQVASLGVGVAAPAYGRVTVVGEAAESSSLKVLTDLSQTLVDAPGIGDTGGMMGIRSRLVVADVATSDQPLVSVWGQASSESTAGTAAIVGVAGLGYGGGAGVALGDIDVAIGGWFTVGYDSDDLPTSGTIGIGVSVFASGAQGLGVARTVTSKVGVYVENQGATGVTDAVGIDIEAQTGASGLNLGLRSAAPVNVGSLTVSATGRLTYPDGTDWRPYTQTQTTWYVDSVTGDDSNDGETPGTALATINEFFNRQALRSEPSAVTLYLSGSFPVETVVAAGRFGSGLTIQGERTTLITGTLTGVVAYDHTPGSVTLGTITDSGLSGQWSNSGPGGSSLINKMIVLTSGAYSGAWAYLLRDEGSKTALVSPWWDSINWAEVTPSPNDTYKVVDLTKVYRLIANDCGFSIDLYDLELLGNPGAWITALTAAGSLLQAHGCIIGGVYAQIHGSYLFSTATYFKSGLMFQEAKFTAYHVTVSGKGLRYQDDYSSSWFCGSNVIYNAGSNPIWIGGQARFEGVVGVIANATIEAPLRLMTNATCIVTENLGSLGVFWFKGPGCSYGVAMSARAVLSWNADTAAEHFWFDSPSANDFLIGTTAKSRADLASTGFTDYVASLVTGAVSGSGASVIRE